MEPATDHDYFDERERMSYGHLKYNMSYLKININLLLGSLIQKMY